MSVMLKFCAAVFECIDNGEKKREGVRRERERKGERERTVSVFSGVIGVYTLKCEAKRH